MKVLLKISFAVSASKKIFTKKVSWIWYLVRRCVPSITCDVATVLYDRIQKLRWCSMDNCVVILMVLHVYKETWEKSWSAHVNLITQKTGTPSP